MFEDLFKFVTEALSQNLGTYLGAVITAIKPLVGASIGLYLVYFAWESLIKDKFNPLDAIKLIASIALITTFALSTPYYLTHIVPIISGLGDGLADAVLGGNGSASALQNMLDGMIEKVDLILAEADFDILDSDTYTDSFLRVLIIGFYIVGGVGYITIATAYLLVAKVMTGLLLIIGPIFIAMAFFPSTRSFFQAWTGQCFNYALLTFMYPFAFTIFDIVVDKIMVMQEPSLENAFYVFVVFGVAVVVSLQIPTFCSTLSGGIGITGIVGSFNSVGRGLGNLATGGAMGRKAMKSGAMWGAGKAAKGASGLYGRLRNSGMKAG